MIQMPGETSFTSRSPDIKPVGAATGKFSRIPQA